MIMLWFGDLKASSFRRDESAVVERQVGGQKVADFRFDS